MHGGAGGCTEVHVGADRCMWVSACTMDEHILQGPKLRLNKAVVCRGPHHRKRDRFIKGKRRCRCTTVHVHENRQRPQREPLTRVISGFVSCT